MTTESNKPHATVEPPFQFSLKHLLLTMAVLGGLLAIIVPLIRWSRQITERETCGNNLRQIAIAIHNYHDTYQEFPPAYQIDATGKPVHSWRLLLWPYAEAQPYYATYNFGEPWNGPSNSRLHSKGSWMYRCPGDRNSRPNTTNYVAAVGDGTMWPGSKSSTVADITDGTSDTIMVVEIANSDIHWMEPRDLPIEELEAWLDPNHKPRIFGNHIQGSFVAYADGHIEMLSRDTTIERLRAIITPAGND